MTIEEAHTATTRHNLKEAHEKIIHCIDQLTDDQLNWRPFEQQNSIANVVLHLCGNVRQWIIAGVEQLPDRRHRPSEFSDRARYAKPDLLARLKKVVDEADATLAR